jgi:hypothetical protein
VVVPKVFSFLFMFLFKEFVERPKQKMGATGEFTETPSCGILLPTPKSVLSISSPVQEPVQ